MTDESTIDTLEEQLRAAMLAGSVDALESLLANDMTSIDQQGRRADKSQELEDRVINGVWTVLSLHYSLVSL